jgi:hypothetical protein
MMRAFVLFCLIAGALAVNRAKLCESGSQCAFAGTVAFDFSQDGSGKASEKQSADVKFTVTSVCEHGGASTFKLEVLSLARGGASADDISSDNNNDEMLRHPLFVTQSLVDGSLSDVVSPELETVEAADFKRGLLDLINFPAAPAVLSGSLSSDLEYEFESVDIHGPHTVKHTVRKHEHGITLLATRTYEKAMEVPSLEAKGEAELSADKLKTTQTGTSKTELTSTGDIKTSQSDNTIKIPGPDNTNEGTKGPYTEDIKGVGESDMKMSVNIKLAGTQKVEAVCSEKGKANPTAFLQTVAGPSAQRIAARAPPRARAPATRPVEAFTAKDMQTAKALLAASEDIVSETMALSKLLKREGAVKAVAAAGLRQYAVNRDPKIFEKLATALASSGRAGQNLAVGLAADEQYPAQLRVKALVALLTSRKVEESLLRAVERLAQSEYVPSTADLPGDDDVPAAASLVLGALIHKHIHQPSEYVKGLVAAMEQALGNGDLTSSERAVHVAALGNAAFPSSSPFIARMAADTQPRHVRLAALRSLRRMAFDPVVETAVFSAARGNDTTVSKEAMRLLQESGRAVTDLQFDEAELGFTFVEAEQELSKSAIHKVTLTEGLYYTYEYDGESATHVIKGSAALNAKIYTAEFPFLEVGVMAERADKSDIFFFVNIMSFEVLKKSLTGGSSAMSTDLQVGGGGFSLTGDGKEVCGGVGPDPPRGIWANGQLGEFGYTKEIFEFKKTFFVYVVTLDVEFSATGHVGVKPGLSVSKCTNARTGKPEVMVMGGMEPFAAVKLTLEASINLFLVRGGVGGEVTIISIGFPLYGMKYFTSGDLCGVLDFVISTCSGELYLFADKREFYWKGWRLKSRWARIGKITIVKWDGPSKTIRILGGCQGKDSEETKKLLWNAQ